MDQTSVEFTKIFVIHTYQIGKIDIVAIFRLLRPSSQFTEVSNTLFKFAPPGSQTVGAEAALYALVKLAGP